MSNYFFKDISKTTMVKHYTDIAIQVNYENIFPAGTVTAGSATLTDINEKPLADGIPYEIGTTNISTWLIAAFSDNSVSVPTGCNKLRVVLIGGGGGGGAGLNNHNTTVQHNHNNHNDNLNVANNDNNNNNNHNITYVAGLPGGGGGGGAFVYLSEIARNNTTPTFIVGNGGGSNTAGQDSTFTVNGTTYTALGGKAGSNIPGAASGTIGSGYALNQAGQAGWWGTANTNSDPNDTTAWGGNGGSGGRMGKDINVLNQYGRGGDGGAGRQHAKYTEGGGPEHIDDPASNSQTGDGAAQNGSAGTNGFIRVYYLFD